MKQHAAFFKLIAIFLSLTLFLETAVYGLDGGALRVPLHVPQERAVEASGKIEHDALALVSPKKVELLKGAIRGNEGQGISNFIKKKILLPVIIGGGSALILGGILALSFAFSKMDPDIYQKTLVSIGQTPILINFSNFIFILTGKAITQWIDWIKTKVKPNSNRAEKPKYHYEWLFSIITAILAAIYVPTAYGLETTHIPNTAVFGPFKIGLWFRPGAELLVASILFNGCIILGLEALKKRWVYKLSWQKIWENTVTNYFGSKKSTPVIPLQRLKKYRFIPRFGGILTWTWIVWPLILKEILNSESLNVAGMALWAARISPFWSLFLVYKASRSDTGTDTDLSEKTNHGMMHKLFALMDKIWRRLFDLFKDRPLLPDCIKFEVLPWVKKLYRGNL